MTVSVKATPATPVKVPGATTRSVTGGPSDRVSTARNGTTGAKPVCSQPVTSTTMWANVDVWTQTRPVASTATSAAAGTVAPATKLRFDASGGVDPHGYTVAKPAWSGSVTVTFTTAPVAPPGATGTATSVTGPEVWRVSSTRWGATAWNGWPAGSHPSRSTMTSAADIV